MVFNKKIKQMVDFAEEIVYIYLCCRDKVYLNCGCSLMVKQEPSKLWS
jgi:hypothetical protein